MYSINHSLLYVLFSMYILISLGKSTMVPSISPVPVLLKCKVVWGSPPPNMTLLILNYCLWAADKKNYSIYRKKKKILQVHFLFHSVLLPKMVLL